jgi:hypothetical protein
LERQSFDYDGPVEQAKGGESRAAAASAEQQRQMENQRASEQLALQRQQLALINRSNEPFLSAEGMGLDPASLAALRSQAIESVPAQFEDARQQLVTELQRRGAGGGALPISGDYLRRLSQLLVGREGLKAGLLRDVTIQDAMTKLQNRFAAGNLALGVGSQYNPATFVQGASSALGSRVSAANAADQASTGIWGSLIGAAGSVLGGTLVPGGIFNRRQAPAPCFVAAELYGGWWSPRAVEIRAWLIASHNPFVRAFAYFYRLFGPNWAQVIHNHARLRAITKFVFDRLPVGNGNGN